MVGNVFRIIMPAQRALVAAIKEGRSPDPALPAKGLLRSRHNNYFTLPVLFIMISNHYPMTYSHPQGWLVLGLIMIAGVLIRQFFVLRHQHQLKPALPLLSEVQLYETFDACSIYRGEKDDAVQGYDEEQVKPGSLGLLRGDGFIRRVLGA